MTIPECIDLIEKMSVTKDDIVVVKVDPNMPDHQKAALRDALNAATLRCNATWLIMPKDYEFSKMTDDHKQQLREMLKVI